jgi:CheY-like chemotaxis protein
VTLERGVKRLSLRGIRVLIVDEPQYAERLTRLLTAEGCDVRIARTASEALADLPGFRPHMVLLELVLPGMSGLVLTRRLKADEVTRHIVVVALSFVDGPAVERLAIEAGCAAYIQKPIDPLTLARTLARYLKGQP